LRPLHALPLRIPLISYDELIAEHWNLDDLKHPNVGYPVPAIMKVEHQ
jgi:hypothetical protein